MKEGLKFYRYLLASLSQDKRITVWHIAFIHAILYLAKDEEFIRPIAISRRTIMQFSHINSYMTYHKYLKELQQFGYIVYYPSYHPLKGSKVQLIYEYARQIPLDRESKT